MILLSYYSSPIRQSKGEVDPMKKANFFKWLMLAIMIAVTVLALVGCRKTDSCATLYCRETGETVTLSAKDTQELQKLLERSGWEEFFYCEYVPNYMLTLDEVEYRFETLDYDPVYNECISYCSKENVLSGIIPREGAEKYKKVLRILRQAIGA